MAFCRWLTKKKERFITLPAEGQWEKATRGTDGRRYPWGSKITPEHVNYVDADIGATNAVGVFPKGESPYHVLDSAGNVWEWTTTKWVGNYQEHRSNDDNLEGDTLRILRGGAWLSTPVYVRCAYRYSFNPEYRLNGVGFRVVLPAVGFPDF